MTRITGKTVDPGQDQSVITFFVNGVEKGRVTSAGSNLGLTGMPMNLQANSMQLVNSVSATYLNVANNSGQTDLDMGAPGDTVNTLSFFGGGIEFDGDASGPAKTLVIFTNGDDNGLCAFGDSSGNPVIQGGEQGNDPAIGFYGTTPVAQPTITGVLSAVVDPNAKAVLTSIINALSTASGVGLAVSGTT